MPPFATKSLLVLYQDNTQQILVEGLMDANANTFVDDAALTVTILDQNREVAAGPLPMVYETGSNGNYVGVVDVSFKCPVGAGYTVVVDGDDQNAHLHLETPAKVVVRTT